MNEQSIETSPQYNAITHLLSQYFDGLYHSDVRRLSQVFHPQAQYYCAVGGELLHLTMAEYFEVVRQRQAPAHFDQPRMDDIVSIDIAGPETALAKVHCAVGERYFTDFLSVIFHQGQWWIISKVFHYDLINSPP